MVRRALLTVLIAFASVVTACRDSSRVVTAPGPSSADTASAVQSTGSAPTTTVPANTIDRTAILAQIAKATTDVCTVATVEDVRKSFREEAPLRTQPMGEAKGPACGYPHPRAGGYLLVIQFQDLSRWDGHAKSGKAIEGLGRDAVVAAEWSAEVVVRDDERSAVVVFMASNPTGERPVEALLDLVASVYGVPREGIRLAA